MNKNMKRVIKALFMVLATVMMLSVPVSAASSKTVATIGKKSYSSLEAAVKKVKDGQTIKLKSDTTVKSALSRDKTYTIDLNGHTLKGKTTLKEPNIGVNMTSQAVKITKGKVALKNGTVTGLSVSKGVTLTSSKTKFSDVVYIKKGATAKIKSGTASKGIYNYGTLIIKKITINTVGIGLWNGFSGKATLKGGTYKCEITNDGKMTISDGTFNYKYNGSVVTNERETGSLTITGGSFKTAYNCAVWNQTGAVMKISGGTFKSTGSNDQDSVMGTIYCGVMSNTEITGGTISSKHSNGIYVCNTATSFKESGAKITVSSSKMKKIRDDR